MKSIVWAIGDAANSNPISIQIGQLIVNDNPDKFIYLGDVYNNGLLEEYQTHYEKAFGKLKEITAPIPGNHDWASGNLHGYKTYWNNIRDYYFFQLAGWTFYCLDSELPHDPKSPQFQWLQKNIHTPAIICLHRPRFSQGPNYPDDLSFQPILDLFNKNTVLILSGHNHNMQDFHPINGCKQLGIGSGGVSQDRPKEHQRLLWSSISPGALRMEVSVGKIQYWFLDTNGDVLFQNSFFDLKSFF